MKFKLRIPAVVLCMISFVSFAGWVWAYWMLVNIGIDLKYMESEAPMHLARQAEWYSIRSLFGRIALVSSLVFGALLIYRWFLVPSRA